MKRFSVALRLRTFLGILQWRFDAIARSSGALVAGLIEEFGPNCMLSVRRIGR